MIVIICAIAALIFAIIYFIRDGWLDFVDGIIWSIFITVIGVLIGCLIFAIANLILSFNHENYIPEKIKSTELIALNDNFHVEGNAFLFSACIDNNLVYTYLYNQEPYGMTTKSINADSVYIQYTDNNTIPLIEEYQEHHPDKIIDLLFMPGETFYIIYVPEGSVIENTYNIDLE